MTRIEAIQSNDNRRSCILPVVEGAALGTVAGYATKYILPLTQEERSTDEYIKVRNQVHSQTTEYGARTVKYLETLKNKETKTLAEDKFVKMFDGMKYGDHVKKSSIRNALKELQAKPDDLREFKRVCKASSEAAQKVARQCMTAYDMAVKHFRPTEFFLATGAVVGAGLAIINNFIKTEVKQ